MDAVRDDVMAALLPAGVVVVSAADPAEAGPLHPEEAAVVAGAVAKRRAEFALSRHCARSALAKLGAPAAPLLPGPHRAPRWPAGVSGAITHCAGYCAAAVTWTAEVPSLGIDAEVNEPLPEGVDDLVLLAPERTWIAARPATAIAWDRLVFSAKESIYKAWFPLTGQWLGFEDAVLHIDPEHRTFRAQLASPSTAEIDLQGFSGRYAIAGGHILTTVTVRSVRSPGPSS
jgi:4'-phosphopantetheinyl transferase EntD